ncbi:ATP-dependent RNA helicase RhlE [Lewinella marina]|uniref:DEAD/DEAH box helicase n=1 Tax=Neolewinella marina TaxID=438751 RepID=A0A2G0CET9_9BACT|nr:DEAD/DEAH box helicase [Neolewinella marina]NJB85838.1 ATP-dependent RNA helicase RhlE [Neolewinella marina]PHK98493.1 DEAD/DEAH box helicase [Neolewinella marina]
MTFADLNLSKFQLSALADLGLEHPTPIQERAFPVVMSGRDVVGIAQTGTGKTLAYLLPLLRKWTFQKHPFPQTLIIVPTRELVVQVVEEIDKLTAYQNVVTVGVYGGVNLKVHAAAVEQGCDFVVGTPGRLYDLTVTGSLKFRALRHLVIDEVDELLELGFLPQLTKILELMPERRQNLLFSATMVPEVEAIIDATFNFPETVEAAPTGTPLDNIAQFGYRVPNFNTKVNLLLHLLTDADTYHRVLVFTPGKRFADLLADQLEEAFPGQVGVIHGNKSQNYRFNSLERFQSGEHRMLIATDLVSRGLDLSDVSHVINLDTPEQPENYIHRIGRTGRADKQGTAVTFTTEAELADLEAIEALMDRKLEVLPLPEAVTVSEELIPEEMPQSQQPIVETKIQVSNQGAFHEKKETNKKRPMTRQELQEYRRRKKARGRKSKKRK